MTVLALSRFNTGVIVVGAGLAVGHWMQPVMGVVLWSRAVPFLALMGLLGGLRGWREAALREPAVNLATRLVLIASFAAGSILLTCLGYVAFHGPPAG